jgi:hypothetical protein
MATGCPLISKLWEIAQHADEYTVATYLALTIILLGLGLFKGMWVPGPWHNKIVKDCSDCHDTLKVVNEKLIDQRILNERSAARIEGLENDVQELKLEVSRLRGALGRVGDRER